MHTDSSPKGGQIEGVVHKQQPASGSTVVLIPDASRSLKGIPPGDYKLFSWEDAEAGARQGPESFGDVKLEREMGTDDQKEKDPEVSASASPDGEDVPAVTLEGQLEAITAERDQLAAEKAEIYDRLLRKQAEFENFRRRSERDRSDFLQFVAMELVGQLVPVLDDFERALKHESSDPGYVKGMELIYQRLFDILKKMGLDPIETAGKKFDPNLHQAVDRLQTEEVEEHTILEEYQRGYNFKGKLLRPSMVKVAVRP